jgi:hypothetical protein
MKQKWLKPPDPTGWNDGLCQDYDKGLSNWFSTRLTAKEDVRRAFPKQFTNLQEPTNENIHRMGIPSD